MMHASLAEFSKANLTISSALAFELAMPGSAFRRDWYCVHGLCFRGCHDQHSAMLILPLNDFLLHWLLRPIFLSGVGVAEVNLYDVLPDVLFVLGLLMLVFLRAACCTCLTPRGKWPVRDIAQFLFSQTGKFWLAQCDGSACSQPPNASGSRGSP